MSLKYDRCTSQGRRWRNARRAPHASRPSEPLGDGRFLMSKVPLYRDTSLMRKCLSLGPYCRHMPMRKRVPFGPYCRHMPLCWQGLTTWLEERIGSLCEDLLPTQCSRWSSESQTVLEWSWSPGTAPRDLSCAARHGVAGLESLLLVPHTNEWSRRRWWRLWEVSAPSSKPSIAPSTVRCSETQIPNTATLHRMPYSWRFASRPTRTQILLSICNQTWSSADQCTPWCAGIHQGVGNKGGNQFSLLANEEKNEKKNAGKEDGQALAARLAEAPPPPPPLRAGPNRRFPISHFLAGRGESASARPEAVHTPHP